MSGNKHDLIRKVADGMVLGRIPRCGACFGGRYLLHYLDLLLIILQEFILVKVFMMILTSLIVEKYSHSSTSKEIHGQIDHNNKLFKYR
jgi:hypothetical protein